jgi:hypothetical protein
MHILAPSATDNSDDVLQEALTGLSLHKEFSTIYRSQGLCIHPLLNQYFLSIPSQPILKLQTMQATMDAWTRSSFAIVSCSQIELINDMPKDIGTKLVVFDYRSQACELDVIIAIYKDTVERKYAYMITPFQAAHFPIEFISKAIVIPLIISRCSWDPHVSQLFSELKDGLGFCSNHPMLELQCDLASYGFVSDEALDTNMIKYNISLAEQEGYKMLSALVSTSMET